MHLGILNLIKGELQINFEFLTPLPCLFWQAQKEAETSRIRMEQQLAEMTALEAQQSIQNQIFLAREKSLSDAHFYRYGSKSRPADRPVMALNLTVFSSLPQLLFRVQLLDRPCYYDAVVLLPASPQCVLPIWLPYFFQCRPTYRLYKFMYARG